MGIKEAMPRAVIFDLGDTVLEERSYNFVAAFKAISAYLSSNVSLKELNESISQAQVGNGEFKLLEWITHNISSNAGSICAEDLELKLWHETVELVPKPGIQQVLDFLTGKGIRIGAISNAIFSSRCMRGELERHKLDGYFEFIISSADHGIKKPDTKIFEFALNTLQMEPHDVWYIGDNWHADIVGATSSGMTAVWFKDRFHDHDTTLGHIKLQKWSDFKDIWR